MKELDRITQHIKGELPTGQKTIGRVSKISNPTEVLENCKKAVIAFLKNSSLESDAQEWRTLMPATFLNFVDQLTEDDYGNDEGLYPWKSIIRHMKDLKSWEWYSSKLTDDGFEIVFTNSFLPRFIWMIHYQQIPYNKIWIMDDRFGDYEDRVIKDVTSYKKFH